MIERTCIVCRQKKEQNQLFRLVQNDQGLIVVQQGKKLKGRGAYICKDLTCIDSLEKSRALNRVFRQNISKENLETIVNNLKN